MTRIQTEIPERRERIAETTLELLAFDTQNPPGETRQVFDWVEQRITELGVEFERVETDPGRPNLVATIPGAREWTLLYEGHLDTVPFERDSWSYDPLGERVDNRLYGRGATDMKGAVAAMLDTMRAFADKTPPVTLQFAFVSDEETGGCAGIDAVLDTDLITANAAVVGETTTVDNEPAIAVADKGRLWLTLEATGQAAHGSRPMCGENAVDRLYSVAADCRESVTEDRLSYPDPVGRIIDDSLDHHAQRCPQHECASRDLFEYPTVNLGKLIGGSAVNSVPQSATAELDVRFTPGVSAEEILERLRRCIDAEPAVEIVDVSAKGGTYVDPEHPFVNAVATAAPSDEEATTFCATGGGDVKSLRSAGIPAVESAVGTSTSHKADEYITSDALDRTATWYRRLPVQLAASDVFG